MTTTTLTALSAALAGAALTFILTILLGRRTIQTSSKLAQANATALDTLTSRASKLLTHVDADMPPFVGARFAVSQLSSPLLQSVANDTITALLRTTPEITRETITIRSQSLAEDSYQALIKHLTKLQQDLNTSIELRFIHSLPVDTFLGNHGERIRHLYHQFTKSGGTIKAIFIGLPIDKGHFTHALFVKLLNCGLHITYLPMERITTSFDLQLLNLSFVPEYSLLFKTTGLLEPSVAIFTNHSKFIQEATEHWRSLQHLAQDEGIEPWERPKDIPKTTQTATH